MNLFDSLQDNMFDTVTNTMGYDATWQPSGGGTAKSAKVLYKGPTQKEELLSVRYDPDALQMEYKAGVFDGLKEAVDSNSMSETVTISGIGTFWVRKVQKLFDGKNYKANLETKLD